MSVARHRHSRAGRVGVCRPGRRRRLRGGLRLSSILWSHLPAAVSPGRPPPRPGGCRLPRRLHAPAAGRRVRGAAPVPPPVRGGVRAVPRGAAAGEPAVWAHPPRGGVCRRLPRAGAVYHPGGGGDAPVRPHVRSGVCGGGRAPLPHLPRLLHGGVRAAAALWPPLCGAVQRVPGGGRRRPRATGRRVPRSVPCGVRAGGRVRPRLQPPVPRRHAVPAVRPALCSRV